MGSTKHIQDRYEHLFFDETQGIGKDLFGGLVNPS
jgi:hypothetical protein